MAEASESSCRATTVTSIRKEKTLVLRSKLDKTKKHLSVLPLHGMTTMVVEMTTPGVKENRENLNKVFKQIKKNMEDTFNSAQTEITNLAPTRPVKQAGQSDADFVKQMEQFQKDTDHYKTLCGLVADVVRTLTNIMNAKLKELTEFSKQLWEKIQSNESDIDSWCQAQMQSLSSDMGKEFDDKMKSWDSLSKSSSL